MRFSTFASTLSLGALVAAAPTTAPAQFAIQITATVDGKPTSLYLAKSINGGGTEKLDQAARCSINSSANLVCEGKTIGADIVLRGYVDMYPMTAVSGSTAMIDGFSVDSNNVLHWKSSKFASLPDVGKTIMEQQHGEAQWGLLRYLGRFSNPQLFSQLGCPGGTHNGAHSELIVGTNKVVPL